VSGTCNNSSECPNNRICSTTSHACVACANDTQCKNDAKYGQHTLCLAGACITGDCHDVSADCADGRICGSTVPHACGDCTTNAQCAADTRYQTGHICVGNLCLNGDCHDNSSECTGSKVGFVCGATTPHTCGACSSDAQCQSDPNYAASICTTANTPKKGQCVANPTGANTLCPANNQACPANAGDFCCGNKCIPGNCCIDTDCDSNPLFGPTYFCRQNTCTRCDLVTGSNYIVDPVNGDDSMATGSGTAGGGTAAAGCAFRTVTKALSAIGSTASAKTVTILGSTTSTPVLLHTTGNPLPVEALPIVIPANVTITTQTGPVKLTLGGSQSGFSLTGDGAKLAPTSATASITIDGANRTSGSGITVPAGTTGTVTINNVTITNPGDDGIQVSAGTVTIGPGVTVTGAGTTALPQNGLSISGGTVNITNTSTSNPTVFSDNSSYGIYVSQTGVLNITGTNTDSAHSVQVLGSGASRSDLGNVDFEPTAVSTTSVLDGLYSSGSTAGDGLQILAGSNVRVRNSTFRANAGNGIHIAPKAGATDPLANIDLGANGTTQAGHNRLQTAITNNANAGAGLCVDINMDGTGLAALRAAGNVFVDHDCATNNPGAIRVVAFCTGATDLGIIKPTGATAAATVNTSACGP
jgi:hypothetical protein